MDTVLIPDGYDKPVYVYVLTDPDTERVRYVGITTRPTSRLREHCKEDPHTYRGYWIQGLISRGLKPKISFIETTNVAEWEARERWWIAYYREIGETLVNATDGGHGALNPTVATRQKISAASKAMWADPDKRDKIIAGMRRTQQTPEEKVRKSAAGKANAAHLKKECDKLWQDPDHLEKMRDVGQAVAKRMWADPAHRERVAEANRRTIAEHMNDPDYAARKSANGTAAMERLRANPETMAKNAMAVSAADKAAWADPVKRAARVAAIREGIARKKAPEV